MRSTWSQELSCEADRLLGRPACKRRPKPNWRRRLRAWGLEVVVHILGLGFRVEGFVQFLCFVFGPYILGGHPHPAIVALSNSDYIRVLLYCYYTTIAGGGPPNTYCFCLFWALANGSRAEGSCPVWDWDCPKVG